MDGRGESAGITLPDLSQLFYDLGCTAAYNLDGGGTSELWLGQKKVNKAIGMREIPGMIYFASAASGD